MGEVHISEVCHVTALGFYLLPANNDLTEADIHLVNVPEREHQLQQHQCDSGICSISSD